MQRRGPPPAALPHASLGGGNVCEIAAEDMWPRSARREVRAVSRRPPPRVLATPERGGPSLPSASDDGTGGTYPRRQTELSAITDKKENRSQDATDSTGKFPGSISVDCPRTRRRWWSRAMPFLLAVAHALALPPTASSKCELTTPLGRLRGAASTDFCSYRAIPYAKPPIGDLRWRPPQPAGAWAPRVLDATRFPSTCMQNPFGGWNTIQNRENRSEDRLYLNAVAPRAPQLLGSDGLRPVIVYLHAVSSTTAHPRP